MQSRLKVYPWSDAKGLSKVLRDPSIWASSFPRLEDRHIVKNAAKKTPTVQNLPQVFNVTDDETFGSILIELLASRRGRDELKKAFAKRFDNFQLRKSIASRLYDHHLKQCMDRIPSSDEIFEKHKESSLLFVSEKLATWLARKELSPEDQRILSLYACYLALRGPEQAEAIREVLVNHDEAFLNWLSDEEVASKAPQSSIPQPLPGPAKANAQVEPQQSVTALAAAPEAVPGGKQLPPEMTALPPDSVELVHLLASCGDWDRELSIDQLRYAVDLLTRKAERHTDRLRELNEIRRRVTNYLKEVAQIPWLESTFSLDRYLSLPQGISAEAALGQLAAVEQEATHLLQVHTQLETLVSRLGSELPPPVAPEVTTLRDRQSISRGVRQS